ncbi:hypothetical protein Mal4_06080 [Maioricimonas rarisocia]|uniref:Large cysteine-rich periplasmic protein OmcB n=1 Tax=Maioricimonas rarisocia TaxID=2528026 RepID=A0A517Z1I1_9PLAN|nr:hypothetical protein [Maioricimonas rarisocia]QDU36323.1 hypothetical protein Mal4_06080 [Maioricimonas rarisocia]
MKPIPQIVRLIMLVLLLCSAGCAWGRRSQTAWRLTDPPGLSPYSRSLNAPEYGTSRPAPNGTGESLPDDLTTNRPVPTEPTPAITPATEDDERMELIVTTVEEATVGDDVIFEIEIRNLTDQPLEGLVISCRFDDAFEFSGRTEQRVMQPLPAIEAEATRELTLSLRATQSGEACAEFTILENDLPQEVETRCVDIAPGPVSLEIVGPSRRAIGDRAEFVVTISNQSGRELDSIVAELAYDEALDPQEASAGAERLEGHLSWTLGKLLVNERVQIQVEFDALSQVDKGCVKASILQNDATIAADEQCLRIIRSAGPLRVQLRDAQDPIAQGETAVFDVALHNRSARPISTLTCTTLLSGGLQFRKAELVDGDEATGIAPRRTNGRMIFGDLPEIPAGAEQILRIHVEATAAGTAELGVIVGGLTSMVPVEVREPLVVNP